MAGPERFASWRGCLSLSHPTLLLEGQAAGTGKTGVQPLCPSSPAWSGLGLRHATQVVTGVPPPSSYQAGGWPGVQAPWGLLDAEMLFSPMATVHL